MDYVFDCAVAKRHLSLGKRIRSIDWPEDTFIYTNKDNTYRDENDEIFKFTDEYDEDEFTFYKDDLCQAQETREKMEESGTKEDGGHQSKSSTEKNMTKAEIEQMNIKEKEMSSEKSDITTMKNTENGEVKKASDIMPGQESINLKERENIEKTTEKSKINTSENTMQKTELINSEKSYPTEGVEILSSDSKQQSENLSLVQSQSMSLIDSSANHLYGLMKLMNPNNGDEEYATIAKVDSSVKVARELRGIMKLKLETLKFSQELKNNK